MKGSDNIEMTINISGELIKLSVKFDDQNSVREAEREVKLFVERMKKTWPNNSDKNILAMAAYQYAKWYQQLLKIQQEAIEIINLKRHQLSDWNAEVQEKDVDGGFFLPDPLA